jgi:hypothetical protein
VFTPKKKQARWNFPCRAGTFSQSLLRNAKTRNSHFSMKLKEKERRADKIFIGRVRVRRQKAPTTVANWLREKHASAAAWCSPSSQKWCSVCCCFPLSRAVWVHFGTPGRALSLPRRSHGTVASKAGRRTVSQSWPAVVPREEGAEQEEKGRKNGFTARGKKRQKSARGALFPRPTVNAFVHYQEMIDY